MNASRLDPELGIVWPIFLTFAGQQQEIGIIPGGDGPARALEELVLALHEWADFIAANADHIVKGAAAAVDAVDERWRFATDPAFELVEASAVRAAAEAWHSHNLAVPGPGECAHCISLEGRCPACD